MAFDINELRKQFPVLSREFNGKPLCYLDNTATTQKPLEVIEATDYFYRHHYSSVKRGAYQLSEETNVAYEGTRVKIQNFINAQQPEEIIYTRGTTESINLVAYSWGKKYLNEGDEIIISALEHHANIVPWQIIAEEKGAVIKVIPCDDEGTLILDEYEKLLSEKTKMVSVTYVSNAIGTVNPVQTIIEMAKKVGSYTLLDCAQASAHKTLDVQKLGCDFLAFSGHKMYAPTGIGILYGRYELLCDMPPYQSGGEMIKQVTFEKTTFAPPPSRFEAGTPEIAGVIGLGSAIEFINKTGMENIHRQEELLLHYATEKFQNIKGLKIIGNSPNKSSLISFIMDYAHPHDVAMILDEEAIAVRTGHHCAQPVMDRFNVPATIRASFAVYNTFDEIDRLIIALKRVEKIFS